MAIERKGGISAILHQSSTLTSEEVKDKVRQALIGSGIARQINERSEDLTENSKVVLKRRYLERRSHS